MARTHDTDRGMSTAEHAVGTVGACTIALLLHQLGTDGYFLDQLVELIRNALAWASILDDFPVKAFQ